MANYEPPTENLPIFDVTVFREIAPYDDFYLKRQGLATSVATETSFSGLVNFNNLATPPHCSAVPTDPNDLANKAYVDALAPKTAYIVYLNYSQTFTTSTPTIYKKLNPLTNNTPTTIALATINTVPQLIAGFFNTKADLKFANIIPTGDWNLVLFANCTATADQNHLGLNFVLYGVTALGVENIIATSASSPLINVLAPLIGTYGCILTISTAIDITLYDQIGIKVYVLSNTSANRNGSIFFQYPSYYSSLTTSFATTQAADITITNNTWTGTNTFNNTTTLNTTIIQGSGTIQFPDTSVQSTAFKSIPNIGTFTNANVTVDAQGAISAISNGVGGSNAQTIDLTLTGAGSGYFIPYSTTTGLASTLLSGGMVYNRGTNTIDVNCTNAANKTAGVAGQLLYQSAPTTTGFVAVGTSNQVLVSNGSSAPSWSTNLAGNAGSSTTVALTGDDTSGDWFIPFSKTTSATSNVLYIDNTTTPLTYNANFGRMSADAYTVGNKVQTAGTISSLLRQTSINMDYINNATSGTHKFYVNDATPTQLIPLTIGSTNIATVVPVNVVTTITATTPSMTVKQSTNSQTINFTPFAPLGTSNPITNVDSSIISVGGGGASRRFVLTTDSATTVGIRMSDVAIQIGAGGIANNALHRISFSDSGGINISSSIVPVVEGYTVPAGSDSSTKIATTAWVQSAIPLATSALADNLTGASLGVLFQSALNTTTRLSQNLLGYILTSGGPLVAPTWQANFTGTSETANRVAVAATTGSGFSIVFSSSATASNALLNTAANLTYNQGTNTLTTNINGSANSATSAGLATQVTLANTATGLTNYLVMSTTNTGTSSLITDTSGATYDSVNNIADINITANSGSATNTAITNDTVSATNHAITFTSNTTGNLPQKTRANVSTGAGLTYVPSTNTLTVNAAGVGAINTGTFTLKNASNNQCDMSNSSGTMNISNNLASSSILLQTADAGSVLSTQVNVSVTDTKVLNKLQTSAGIIGPINVLTYASNMIGYSSNIIAGNGVTTTVTTAVWAPMTETGFLFPQAGVYLMTLNIYCTKSAAAGNLLFLSAGMSTVSTNTTPSGQGSFSVNICSTASQPAVAGFLFGTCTMPMVITNTATVYYMMFQAGFTGVVYTKSFANSWYKYVRIA